MIFRRLYWVTEQHGADGRSEVTGVFTSVPDLIECGLGVRDISGFSAGYRISLVQLDSRRAPVARISPAEPASVRATLEEFIKSGELSEEEVIGLQEAIAKG